MEQLKDIVNSAKAKSATPETTALTKASVSTLDVSMRDVPAQYARWCLGNYTQALRDALAPFFALKVWCVYLHGIVGSRKSSIAAAILRHIRERQAWGSEDTAYGEWISPAKLRRAMLDFELGKFVLEHWREARVLVFDDLGALRGTAHAQETQMNMIDDRYDAQRRTIVTSNLTLTELAAQIDSRVASRLQEGVVLDLGTKDWRKARHA